MIKEESTLVPAEDSSIEFTPEYEEIDLEEFSKTTFSNIENENIEEELKRFKRWKKNRAFYRGDQRGFWDTKKRTWVTIDLDSLSPSEASVLVVNNQFRPQVKTLAKEFSRSQTRVRANRRSDSQRSVLTARFSDDLIRYYQPEILPSSARQLEAKYLLLCGNAFRYTRYDKTKRSVVIDKPVFGDKILPEYTKSVCSDCGHSEDVLMSKCPECDSTMNQNSVPEKTIPNQVVGYSQANSGDPNTEIVDPSEIKVWAGAKNGLLDTPYLRRRRFVRIEFIKSAFPFYKVSEKAKLSDVAQAQWQFSDISTLKDTNQLRGTYQYDQYWLDVGMYAGKKLEKDVAFKKKVNGKWTNYTLSKGTILEDQFPDGLYICKVGEDILGYYSENKLDFWLHTPFDINVDGFWSDGLEDSIMNQQLINEYTSLSVENILYNASPKLVINPSLINPVTVTGRPKDMILMSDNARRDNEPKQAFSQIAGMSLTPDVMLGLENAKRDMREQTGALLAFNGQGDPNVRTATGMSIARDSALALVSTPLELRAETDKKWCYQVIKFVKKNWYDKKYSFLLGKYNEAEAEAFRDSEFDKEVALYVEPNSWTPMTNVEKTQNLGAFLTAFGIPLGFLNPQIPDTIRQYGIQLYNIPLDFDELLPDIRIAQKRLDTAKEVAEKVIPQALMGAKALGDKGDLKAGQDLLYKTSVVIANAMSVEEDIDDHAVFIDEYKKYLKTDEGQEANPILRTAIKHAIADHKMFLKTQMGEDAQQQMLLNGGQPPQANAQGQQNTWQASQPPDSPFQVNSQVQDFSGNKNNSNL